MDTAIILNVVVAIGAVLLGVIVSRILTRFIQKALESTGSSTGGASIVVNLVRGLIAIMVIYFVGENVFHVQMGGLVQALGITTLVVSFGLQDLIKNLVAGIQIIITHLFSVGDQIELGDRRGEIVDINWRQTTMRDKDNNLHVIPNAEIMGATFMRRVDAMERRYLFECDIKPGLDLERVARDIEQLADEVLDAKGWKSDEPSEVRYVGSTANGVCASVRIYLNDISHTVRGYDAVMRAIGARGYLADWTNESPAQEQWRPSGQSPEE
ncbi:MAG: mechanosensitive ion channel [Atopobiaceae bacterium]|nr:mechanosensitive ion channel [Atopobiaceae bacterium]